MKNKVSNRETRGEEGCISIFQSKYEILLDFRINGKITPAVNRLLGLEFFIDPYHAYFAS